MSLVHPGAGHSVSPWSINRVKALWRSLKATHRRTVYRVRLLIRPPQEAHVRMVEDHWSRSRSVEVWTLYRTSPHCPTVREDGWWCGANSTWGEGWSTSRLAGHWWPQSHSMHQYGGAAYTWQASSLRAQMMVACLDQLGTYQEAAGAKATSRRE
jgi:hypothetical protein